MQKNLILGLAVLVLIAGAFYWGYGYRARTDAQKTEVVQRILDDIQPRNVIGGSVTAINGNTLTIETSDIISGKSVKREVVVSDGTLLVRLAYKSDEEKAADLREYRAKLAGATSSESVQSPSVIKSENIVLSDLRVGNFIDVSTASPIGDNTSLEATKIIVELPRPE
ncbi:MAG: hypothetical protein UY99_C0003G0004 [Parcubacteria group bacterium GW2011_GWA1_59_11]|nr:MAG: hypothetical protein UY99_C0003G0004 [Parcubacteria group bacterium GW2011_GWA1_59_11]